jgi:ATP-dependent DNA ligase
MTYTKTFPKLYKKNNFWEISVKDQWITIKHGIFNGQYQTESLELASPASASAEAASRWNKKVDRELYSENPYNFPKQPMLALEFESNLDKLPSDVFFQPKLDGIRCIANNSELMSRQNTRINSVPHIAMLLSNIPDNIVLDGELYCHGLDFQTHQKLIRPDSPHEEFMKIKYHVFDIQSDDPFFMRHQQVNQVLGSLTLLNEHIVAVETIPGKKEDVEKVTDHFIGQGYEGTIVRHPYTKYEYGQRSASLQKYKRFDTSEFRITGWTCSTKGREKGCAIAICSLEKNGPFKPLTFQARLTGSLEYRKAVYENQPVILDNLYARIRHHGFYESGLPKQPICDSYFYE